MTIVAVEPDRRPGTFPFTSATIRTWRAWSWNGSMFLIVAVGSAASSSASVGSHQTRTCRSRVPVTANGASGAKAPHVTGASLQMYWRNSAARPRGLVTGLRHSCKRLSAAQAVSTVLPSGEKIAKVVKLMVLDELVITALVERSDRERTRSCLP